MPTANEIQTAIASVQRAASDYVRANPENRNDWFPCGFAWLTYKCRKNAKESSVLLDNGFRWDDYRKCYTLSAFQFANTQSMNYQEAILRHAVKTADLPAGITFNVESRID